MTVNFIVLFIVLLGSLTGNIYQIQKINRVNDKTTNGITRENLHKLENIFNSNRDNKTIKEIRKEVEDYEKNITETAEKIERERLKESKIKR